MTLAVFLLIATSWAVSPQSSQATTTVSTQSSAETSHPAPEKQEQTQSNAPANTAPEAKPQTSPAPTPKRPPAAKHQRHKKKPSAVNCDTATTATSDTANADNSSAGSNAAADPPTANKGAAPASKKCPPTKTIVRQGGTSEPSIQLAPSTDQAARQRDVVNQLLAATDANLKRIGGKQLNTNEQATLGQIRDYEQQSRTAIGEGDLERARTLAWKAELLSEDLIKPAK